MAVVLKQFEQIPIEWLNLHYADIKESLGYGYSYDRIFDFGRAMTDEEVMILQKECIKQWKVKKVKAKRKLSMRRMR